LFGEVHGTNEIPAVVGGAACAASSKGRVHVGLELPVGDSRLLATFLSGNGDEGLRDSSLWRGPQQYGVTSSAMLELLKSLRDLRRNGAPLEVFFFDDRIRLGMKGRDQAMAEHISEERRRAPEDIYLILVGNFHARNVIGAPWDAQMRWMAHFLASRERRMITLDVRTHAGSAWACFQKGPGGPESCGSSPIRGSLPEGASNNRAVKLEPVPQLGYDGAYSVGTVSASPPAFP
jgi:hypothetical protein